MKSSNKSRLRHLEKQYRATDNLIDPVIIYDPKLPMPDLSRFGDRIVILIPDNQR